jgi:hypothetical protein
MMDDKSNSIGLDSVYVTGWRFWTKEKAKKEIVQRSSVRFQIQNVFSLPLRQLRRAHHEANERRTASSRHTMVALSVYMPSCPTIKTLFVGAMTIYTIY